MSVYYVWSAWGEFANGDTYEVRKSHTHIFDVSVTEAEDTHILAYAMVTDAFSAYTIERDYDGRAYITRGDEQRQIVVESVCFCRTCQQVTDDCDCSQCTQCDQPNDDGEGYDGLCGNCADRVHGQDL